MNDLRRRWLRHNLGEPGRLLFNDDSSILYVVFGLYLSIFLLDLSGLKFMEVFYVVPIFIFSYVSILHIAVSSLLGIGLIFLGSSGWINGLSAPLAEWETGRTFVALFIALAAFISVIHRKQFLSLARSNTALREAQSLVRLGHFQLAVGRPSGFQCSHECLEIVGRDDLDTMTLQTALRKLVHPQDLHRVVRQIGEARKRGGKYHLECRIVRSDGKVCDIISVGYFERRGNARPARLTGTLLDVSDWKGAERARAASAARLKSVLDTVFDALVIVDLDHKIDTFSASAEALFGHAAIEMEARPFGELFVRRHRRAIEGLIDEAARPPRGVVRRGPFMARRKDGSSFPVELAITAIAGEGERRTTVFLRDLTESRKLEAQLRDAHKIEAIGRLSAGIAHDFNNILTMIIANLELMEDVPAHRSSERLLRETRETAELGAQLTQRLLAFGRRDAPDAGPTDLNTTLGDMMEILRRPMGKAIELHFRASSTVRPIAIDATQLKVAVLNLVLNARDAMPAGGTLVVSIGNADVTDDDPSAPGVSAGRYVVVAVSDDGAGMPEAVRLRATEPFFTTKDWGKGTGLGLPTVGAFVANSGGHMTIDSEPNRGTTVRLFLPRNTARPRVPAPAQHPIPLAGAPRPLGPLYTDGATD